MLICDTHFFQRLHGVVNYVDLPECSSQETLCRGMEQHGIVERDQMRCEVVPHWDQVTRRDLEVGVLSWLLAQDDHPELRRARPTGRSWVVDISR